MAAPRIDVWNVATPLPFSGAVPIVFVPSLNVTGPVGMGVDPVTVAVKVSNVPYVDGVRLVARLVVVGDPTFSVAGAVRIVPPLVPLIVSGYVPDCEPLGVTVKVVDPEPFTDAGLKFDVAPAGTPLTLNATVPVNPPL